MSHLGLLKIISGGQTGVDEGALWATQTIRVESGGWVPRGFMTMDGPNLKLGTHFGCSELSYRDESLSQQYVRRSKQNVDDADGCLAVRTHSSLGTDFTLGYCIWGR